MNPNSINRLAATRMLCVGALIFSSSVFAADAAQEPESGSARVSDAAVFDLSKQSFTLGLAYAQVTYKARQPSYTQITDNGAPSPIIELTSSEKTLRDWPLRTGSAVLGWDINASASIFDTRYQLVNSAFRGQNIGTDVRGGYIGLAPMLFLKVGPLYPDTQLYWKVGYGIGPGLLKSSGTAAFSSSTGTVIGNVGSSAPALALYNTATWQLQAGNWYFDMTGKMFTTHDSSHSSLESYGFGVAYRFGW